MVTDSVSFNRTDKRYRRSRMFNVILTALVLFLAVVVIAQQNTDNETSAADAVSGATGGAGADSVVRRIPDDPMAVGAVDAPVVMVEWTDLRCPFCASFNRETMPTLKNDYVDSGRVRIEVRDVAFFGRQSADAAIAARAAGKQGKYFDYTSAIFESAPDGGHPDLPREALIDFANQVDVPDMNKFVNDLRDAGLAEEVTQSTTRAQALGVNSVPFFVVDGVTVSGAQPETAFRKLLDDALAKAR